ncbi:MAG TPA: tRNA (guanosine(37)-N1)-methyltransferase TrmD [Gammaproteobacteria bacterium]|nr:tRNA (guanosine(37)-N1)-methyltransferase TrmD [Gammaproteobacteria bacterium]
MWFGIITLLPEMLQSLQYGVTGRGIKNGRLMVETWNPRDFTQDKHKTVDDKPYGGGPGMVMMTQPLRDAIKAARNAAPNPPKVVYLSPQGRRFDQQTAESFLKTESMILICGRYEGIDERIIQADIDEEWSIGDYVLSGGELAAMVIVDAVSRLVPGVVKEEDSVTQDSLSSGLLKYPQYTRPEELDDVRVPEILLSGNHKAIEEWRLKQSLGKTWLKRPDLLAKLTLDSKQQKLLQEFMDEHQSSSQRKE